LIRLLALVAALAWSVPADATEAMPADSVAVIVFEADLLANVAVPSVIHYRYDMQGRGIDPPFVSHGRMSLATGDEDGVKAASFELFEGPNQRVFGPLSARNVNPMVLVFLQRDVSNMGKLTGAAAGYFQQGLRQGFGEAATVEAVDVEIDGASVAVQKISIRPFENDPEIGRFPQFRDKTYSFWVGEDVPGGLYRIESVTPDIESGEVILLERFTFERIEIGAPGD